ncbi:MAG: biotin--[acetyl-CoA-carboxylase] ligase [Woeseia sp.]
MLDAENIRAPITGMSRARLDILEVFSEIESTNSYLLDQPSPPPGRFRVAVADYQTAGRGRLDRTWQSPPSSGLCLSMAYTFRTIPEKLPSLTLALGVGIVEALARLGIDRISLKWPNDIIACGGKLGGILTEAQSDMGEGATVIAGVGLNVELPDRMRIEDGLPSTEKIMDLKGCAGSPPSREKLSVAVIESLFDCMVRFETDGFAPFQDSWGKRDWLRGKEIIVDTPTGRYSGVAEGVDHDGALIIRTGEQQRRVLTGTITLPEKPDSYA